MTICARKHFFQQRGDCKLKEGGGRQGVRGAYSSNGRLPLLKDTAAFFVFGTCFTSPMKIRS